MALTTYLAAREHGVAFTALPVFLVRGFHHGAIRYDTRHGHPRAEGPRGQAGRRQPRLHGDHRRVGPRRSSPTSTAWTSTRHLGALRRRARGGVPAAGERRAGPAGRATSARCWSAASSPPSIGVDIDHPDVAPLIPDPEEAGARRAAAARPLPDQPPGRRPGRAAAAHPDLATAVFDAFAEAKRRYVERLRAGDSAHRDRPDVRPGAGDHRRRPAALRHRAEPRRCSRS